MKLVETMEVSRVEAMVAEQKLKVEIESAQRAKDESLVAGSKLQVAMAQIEDKKIEAQWFKDKFFDCVLALVAVALPVMGTLAHWFWKSYSQNSAVHARSAD